MNILNINSEFPQNVSLILGFFDGVHAGHRKVIESAVNYAKSHNSKTVLVTFKDSPAAYFKGKDMVEYISPREVSYNIVENLGVDFIFEINFEDLVSLEASEYLENFLIKRFSPISISTGFNHTFGNNKSGDSNLLEAGQEKFNYKYFCASPQLYGENVVSSTYIKEFLKKGDIVTANLLLKNKFSLQSTVIDGLKLGRKLGYPTANMDYPKNIIKIPYGVYKVIVDNKPAILNWGIKPTLNGKEEILEVHILNFNENLYGETLKVEVVQKLRDEKKFDSLEELKCQIKKDIELCSKL